MSIPSLHYSLQGHPRMHALPAVNTGSTACHTQYSHFLTVDARETRIPCAMNEMVGSLVRSTACHTQCSRAVCECEYVCVTYIYLCVRCASVCAGTRHHVYT